MKRYFDPYIQILNEFCFFLFSFFFFLSISFLFSFIFYFCFFRFIDYKYKLFVQHNRIKKMAKHLSWEYAYCFLFFLSLLCLKSNTTIWHINNNNNVIDHSHSQRVVPGSRRMTIFYIHYLLQLSGLLAQIQSICLNLFVGNPRENFPMCIRITVFFYYIVPIDIFRVNP